MISVNVPVCFSLFVISAISFCAGFIQSSPGHNAPFWSTKTTFPAPNCNNEFTDRDSSRSCSIDHKCLHLPFSFRQILRHLIILLLQRWLFHADHHGILEYLILLLNVFQSQNILVRKYLLN